VNGAYQTFDSRLPLQFCVLKVLTSDSETKPTALSGLRGLLLFAREVADP